MTQWRFDEKTGGLWKKEAGMPKFKVGNKVRLTEEWRIHDGVFEVTGVGADISSGSILYSCSRVNEKGDTIWFSCIGDLLEVIE